MKRLPALSPLLKGWWRALKSLPDPRRLRAGRVLALPPLALAGCAAVLLVGAAAALALSGDTKVRYAGVPRIELALAGPADPGARQGTAPPVAPTSITPAPVDPALLASGPSGLLPVVGPDGRTPFKAYARPFEPAAGPKVAIMLVGLGLRSDAIEAALALPGEASLQFSPYARGLARSLERARRAGHEVFLELPMQPEDFPADDPGPRALLADLGTEQNLERLQAVLASAAGYCGLAGNGGSFAASAAAEPALRELAKRGLALVEIGTGSLAGVAAQAGLPYVQSTLALDDDLTAAGFDAALADLETRARETGVALGVARPYPLLLRRIGHWAKTLADKGIVLAPVSALVPQGGAAAARSQQQSKSAGLASRR